MKANRLALSAVALSAVVAMLLGFAGGRLFDPRLAFAHSGYWFMWALLLAFALCLHDLARDGRFGPLLRRPALRRLALVSLLAVLAIRLAIGYQFRILSDETNLLGTSLSLWLNHTAQNISEGQLYSGAYHVISQDLPTRPLLYPFLISLLHALFGFDGDNGFRVNLVAAFAALLATGVFASRLCGTAYGALSLMLLAAFPLFITCASSSGFETLNALMLILLAAQLWQFLREPGYADAELLLLLALAAANCRYESIIALVPVGIALALRARTLLAQPIPLRLALLPLLLLPLIWQRLFSDPLNPGDAPRATFSAAYLGEHLSAAARFFLNLDGGHYATLGCVFAAALCGLVLAAGRVWSARRSDPVRLTYASLAGMGVLGILFVQCAYYLGDMRLAIDARLGLSFVPAIVLLAAYAVHELAERLGDQGRIGAFVAAAALLVHGYTEAQHNQAGRSLYLFHEYASNLQFLRRHPAEGTLIISDRPSMYAAQQLSAVSFNWANHHVARIEADLRRRRFHRVFVIQQIGFDGSAHQPALDPAYRLQPVWEYQRSPRDYVRISSIVLADAAPGAWPALDPDAPVPAHRARHKYDRDAEQRADSASEGESSSDPGQTIDAEPSAVDGENAAAPAASASDQARDEPPR